MRELAARAGVSVGMVYRVEAGQVASTETAKRWRRRLVGELSCSSLIPGGAISRPSLAADPVHSLMGEFEARQFRALGVATGIDEPYQHFQFAGRADFVAWRLDPAALLHIENRTRFPDFQEMAGSFNAKRAYLGASLGEPAGSPNVAQRDARDRGAVVRRGPSRHPAADRVVPFALPGRD